jgi:hypothetical protein
MWYIGSTKGKILDKIDLNNIKTRIKELYLETISKYYLGILIRW